MPPATPLPAVLPPEVTPLTATAIRASRLSATSGPRATSATPSSAAGSRYPASIMSLLGLPEEDYGRMHMLTQEMFGGDDDEYKRGVSPEEQMAVLLDFFAYFAKLTASRRENPTDDLASAIANGTLSMRARVWAR